MPGPRRLLWLLLVLGLLLRSLDVLQPIRQTDWREADMAAIARSFHREGEDLLHPRIDWRGDGPGFAEMELPIVPYLSSWVYRETGEVEWVGRLLEVLFSLGSMVAFFGIARELLPEGAAVAAAAFFAVNPLAVDLGPALHPEGPMLCFGLVGLHHLLRWQRRGSLFDLCVCAAATSLAALAKASWLHIGVFYAVVLLRGQGWAVVRRPAVWLLGLVSVVPAALWCLYARGFWIEYGNSLGVSNESHWFGLDLLLHSWWLEGIGRHLEDHVFLPLGFLVAAFGLVRWYRSGSFGVIAGWWCAVLLFDLLAARTVGDVWAAHYHVIAIAPACLLIGAAYAWLEEWRPGRALLRVAVTGVCIAAALSTALYLVPRFAHLATKVSVSLGFVALVGLLLLPRRAAAATTDEIGPRAEPSVPKSPLLALVRVAAFGFLWVAFGGALSSAVRQIPSRTWPESSALYDFAARVRPLLTEPGLLLTSGGTKYDEQGHPVAHDAPYMFYWLDRHGFALAQEDHTVENVEHLAARGARYFVLECRAVHDDPAQIEALSAPYRILARWPEALLLDLGVRTPSELR